MFKKREQTTLGIKFQKKRKIAVLVTTVVMLVGIGLNPMLVIFGEINASSESQKVRATKLDSEDSTEEQDEEVKETIEEVKETIEEVKETIEEATVESELTEEKEVIEKEVIEKQEIVEEQKEVTVEFESSKEQVAKVDPPTFQGRWGTSIFIFDYNTGVLTIKAGNLGLSSNAPWLDKSNNIIESKIKEIVLEETVVAPDDSSYLFANLTNMTGIINLDKLDTSKVTNMNHMFSICYVLKSLDLSGFDTSNVTDMKYMFAACGSLKSLDLSGFDTSKVTNMRTMFATCVNLESIDLSGFDTSKVTNMFQMFYQCILLESIDLSGINTSNVTSMEEMFGRCYVLKSLDLSGFDTSNVTDMKYMFELCRSLKSLDLSGFNTSNVSSMNYMFYQCISLESLDLSGFNTSKVVNMKDTFVDVRLKKLILGDNLKFTKMNFNFSPGLGAPKEMNTGDALTGNWIREDGQSSGYSPADFMEKYGTEELTAGAYVAEIKKKELIFNEVPLNLSFNESKISSKTLEIQRKEVEWKIVVKDTRDYKKNWRVTAKLEKPFKTVNGDLLENILHYRKKNMQDQLIGTTDAVNVFDSGATTTTTSLTDVKWNEGEGPYLKVAPGTAKIGRYECEIQWALIDAPI